MAERYDVVPSLGIALRLGVDGWGVSLLLLTGLVIVAGVISVLVVGFTIAAAPKVRAMS